MEIDIILTECSETRIIEIVGLGWRQISLQLFVSPNKLMRKGYECDSVQILEVRICTCATASSNRA